jgi:hypothetical protein
MFILDYIPLFIVVCLARKKESIYINIYTKERKNFSLFKRPFALYESYIPFRISGTPAPIYPFGEEVVSQEQQLCVYQS